MKDQLDTVSMRACTARILPVLGCIQVVLSSFRAPASRGVVIAKSIPEDVEALCPNVLLTMTGVCITYVASCCGNQIWGLVVNESCQQVRSLSDSLD
jgi:hypothetical protein